MGRGHIVKLGDDWVDGFGVGREAAMRDSAFRKEQREFEALCRKLYGRKWWKGYYAKLSPEAKARKLARARKWAQENPERYRAAVNAAKRRGRKTKAKWYRDQLVKKRAKFAETTRARRAEVHTCIVCGAQWCIAFGRIPCRPPKYCSTRCCARARWQRARAAGKPWAQRTKEFRRDRRPRQAQEATAP